MKKIILALFILSPFFGAAQSYALQYSTATSGTVTAIDQAQHVLLIHDAGATITLTVAFPATPYNGQRFKLVSAGGVTTLTLSTVTGSILNALTTIATGGSSEWIYVTAQTKWYKIQ
jgi:hypothetical protein